MISVQKVFNLQAAPQEKYTGSACRSELKLPFKGEICFDRVELRYRSNTEIVLHELDFKVQPGEKIGIVGRTASGKTTISMALARIVELKSGQIFIDGIDIATMDLSLLREQITMIPQDPVMIAGTLRQNLDPFQESTDARMVELIGKAGLGHLLIESQLSFVVQEDGKNLSLGER